MFIVPANRWVVVAVAVSGCAAGTTPRSEPAQQPAAVSNVVVVPARAGHAEPRATAAAPEEAPERTTTGSPRDAARAPPTAPATPAALATARARFDEGVAAYTDGRFADAKRAFGEAYALAPMPQVLYNLASTEIQLGEVTEGCRHLEEWKAQAKPPASRLNAAASAFPMCTTP